MASNAVPFQGTLLNARDTVTSVVTNIGEVTSLNGPSGRASIIDVTHSQSAGVEKRMGLPDEGGISVGANLIFGDDGHNLLLNNRAAQSLDVYEIVFPDAGSNVWEFDANILSYAVNGSRNGYYAVTCDMEISGLVRRNP